jgi:hypothetical protein
MSHPIQSSRGSSTCQWYAVGRKMSDKSASETSALLTLAYVEYAMKKLSVFEWHRQEDVQGDPRNGQAKTQRTAANVDRVRTLVCSDRRLGVILEC